MEDKKVALITGGTRGIGKAIAIKFAKNGYNLVLNYVSDRTNLEELENEFKEYNIEVLFIFFVFHVLGSFLAHCLL